MFGKTGVFRDGVMFGMVADNMLYFRVDEDNRRSSTKASPLRPSTTRRRAPP
jgi:DNA transformation protein